MIPPDTSRAFGSVLASPSPRLTEVDLAKIIDRTVKMAIAAKRQLGFAAITTGCDGVRRTSMFDGSACQVEGDAVCVAERQDGITACLQVPMQGSGIVFQSISFRSVPCVPATGWYVLDDEGYLYRIPADLLVPVDYWPVETDVSGRRYDLVRAGAWDVVMCAAPLTPPTLNGEGSSLFVDYGFTGESLACSTQQFRARIGGRMSGLYTVPSVTVGTEKVTVSPYVGWWHGVVHTMAAALDVTLDQYDRASSPLTSGKEYKALVYAQKSTGYTASVDVVKGYRANTGLATLPVNPQPGFYYPLAEVTVRYTGIPILSTSVGSSVPVNLDTPRILGNAHPSEALGVFTGILIRDSLEPNAGVRCLTVTLPSAGSGVVTGDVRIGFGYPMALEMLTEQLDAGSPFGFSPGPTAGEIAARTDYDMAFVYGPSRIGIEYTPWGHVNLQGPDIEEPNDCTILSSEVADDIAGNILQLPNGEVCLSRSLSTGGTPVVPQIWERFRVRPAPDTAPTVALAQAAWSGWGNDANAWIQSPFGMSVRDWAALDTTVRLVAGVWEHGRPMPCVVWQQSGAVSHWSLDPNAKTATLGEPTGDTCPIVFDSGTWPTLVPSSDQKVSLLGGPYLAAAYGWTFTVNGVESALSPLSPLARLIQPAMTYTITLTVPVGPAGTTERTIYRFAYDLDALGHNVGSTWRYRSPWDLRTEMVGALYDRMLSAVGSISDNVTTEWVDDQTALSFAGTRPPQPLIAVGSGITMDTTRRVYALPPLNL